MFYKPTQIIVHKANEIQKFEIECPKNLHHACLRLLNIYIEYYKNTNIVLLYTLKRDNGAKSLPILNINLIH